MIPKFHSQLFFLILAPDGDVSLMIDDLLPETTYTVEVSAINEDSTGQYAGPAQEDVVTFDTLTFRK